VDRHPDPPCAAFLTSWLAVHGVPVRAAFLLGAGEEADDDVQEAFVKAFRHLSRFRVGEPFGPWLLRIVANETRNLTRSRRRRAALRWPFGCPLRNRGARQRMVLSMRCWPRNGAPGWWRL
jgi:DNA-directed RNA polymerase specialized sigma24 family protein